jgi:hypothetical protein
LLFSPVWVFLEVPSIPIVAGLVQAGCAAAFARECMRGRPLWLQKTAYHVHRQNLFGTGCRIAPDSFDQ